MAAWRLHSRRRAWPSWPVTGSGQVDAACGQMAHQADEPGQLGRVHAALVEGQDVVALRGAQGVVAVLHTLGDAAEGDQGADVVLAQELGELAVGDLGIDRHALPIAGGGFVRKAR